MIAQAFSLCSNNGHVVSSCKQDALRHLNNVQLLPFSFSLFTHANMSDYTRKEALKMLGVSAMGAVPMGMKSASGFPIQDQKLKILVAGAHPDDPETGCGGTVARYTKAGHEVVNLYLTRGEGGIPNKTHDEAAEIRTAEAQKACEILNARSLFAGQVDGETEVSAKAYSHIREMIETENPDLIFTQWPVDTHRDHRAISVLVYDAWLNSGKSVPLYYYEVMSGIQTQSFNPTDYVDITSVEEIKREACFAHESQNPDELYPIHEQMSRFRGMEFGCDHAEAFVRHEQSPPFRLIG